MQREYGCVDLATHTLNDTDAVQLWGDGRSEMGSDIDPILVTFATSHPEMSPNVKGMRTLSQRNWQNGSSRHSLLICVHGITSGPIWNDQKTQFRFARGKQRGERCLWIIEPPCADP